MENSLECLQTFKEHFNGVSYFKLLFPQDEAHTYQLEEGKKKMIKILDELKVRYIF